jgi:hypothetical protein
MKVALLIQKQLIYFCINRAVKTNNNLMFDSVILILDGMKGLIDNVSKYAVATRK